MTANESIHKLSFSNGVCVHDLTHEELCTTVLEQAEAILQPGLNAINTNDNFLLWSWCGELLVGPQPERVEDWEMPIRSLFQTTIHAALASSQIAHTGSHPNHIQQLATASLQILPYLCFPLLEAKLKAACSDYVSSNGQVIANFSVPDSEDGQIYYSTTKIKGQRTRQQISSLRDLLFLHNRDVATPELNSKLQRFQSYIRQFDPEKDTYDLIYSWRNQSLHGETTFRTIGGTLLNLIILISLFEIKEKFDERKNHCLSRLNAWRPPSRAAWSFYPPH